jgi:hypothetical protein
MTTEDFREGPYLTAALICERVLDEKDNVKSIIRIVDRVNHQVVGPDPPREMPPIKGYRLTMLLQFKSGRARGAHALKLRLLKPSGESTQPPEQLVVFEGEDDRGVDVVANLLVDLEYAGVYWIEVLLNEVRVTKVPFRVVYLPQKR